MENQEVEEVKVENKEVEETAIAQVKGFGELASKSQTKCYIETNMTDQKKMFNLESHIDNKLNDCKGELIRVKEVMVKTYEKPLKEPVVDEETGEIVKDKEYKRVCILVDDNGKSYVTGSSIFTLQMLKYIKMFGLTKMETEGVEIRIIETPVKNSGNKALGFELV
jgi:hypothetical protein